MHVVMGLYRQILGCQQLAQSGLKKNLSRVLRVVVYSQLILEALVVATGNLDSGPCALNDSKGRAVSGRQILCDGQI